MQRPANSLPRPIIWLGIAVVLLTAFSYAFTPLRASQDEWWHLKTGKWIVEHQTLPRNDIFTYTGEDYRWYNHEWLSQVLFYASYAMGEGVGLGGVRGLVLFKSIVVVGTFALLMRLVRMRGAGWAATLLITLCAAEISRRTIYPRPPIFSYLLLTCFLLILYAWKYGRLRSPWLWLLPALTVLWGNLHGMVLLAIIAVGAFAGGETIEWLLQILRSRRGSSNGAKTSKRRDKSAAVEPATQLAAPLDYKRSVLLLYGVLVATIIASLAQPSGYHLFFLGKNFTDDPVLKRVILEMLPPPFFLQSTPAGASAFVPGFATFWIAAAALPILLLLNRGRLPFVADYLLAGFFLYQGVMHWRLLPLFAIGAAPAFGALAADLRERWQFTMRPAVIYSTLAATTALALSFVFLINENGTYFRRNLDLVRGNVMSPEDYPAPLLDFIEKMELPDRMFSESNYCGYFMWRLSPEKHKLFTDNRFDLFGSRFYKQEQIILAAGNKGDRFGREGEPFEKGWEQLLDEWGVNFIVIHRDARYTHLQEALIASDKWTDIYYYMPPSALTGKQFDPKAGISVWLRKDAKTAELPDRALEYFRREHPGWPRPEHLDAYLMADPEFLASKQKSQNSTSSSWRVPIGK